MILEAIRPYNLYARAADFGEQPAALMGRVLHAQVLDYHNGKAVLRIEGEMITAESEVPLAPFAELDLAVKGIEPGRIFLQVVSQQGESIRTLTDADISSRLIGFDLPADRLTIAVVRSLLSTGIPITKQNIQSLLNILPPDATEPQISFLTSALKENIPLTRDLLALQSSLKQNLNELSSNLHDFFNLLLESRNAPKPYSLVPNNIRENMLQFLSLPSYENETESAAKINAFTKNFLTATESKLTAEIIPSLPLYPFNADSLIENLLLLLK